MKLYRLLFIALLISFFASCSKDDDKSQKVETTAQHIKFTDGKISETWELVNWEIYHGEGFDDLYCLKDITAEGGAVTKYTFEKESSITFYAKNNSNTTIYFYIDGVLKKKISSDDFLWQKQTFNVPAGEHVFKWEAWCGSYDYKIIALLDEITFNEGVVIEE